MPGRLALSMTVLIIMISTTGVADATGLVIDDF
jgi:hypothetical protein